MPQKSTAKPKEPSDPTTLVLSVPEDETASLVVEELRRRQHAVYWFDTTSFPLKTQLSARNDGLGWDICLSGADSKLAFTDIVSIWYRRPRVFEFDPSLTDAERRWARVEAQVALGGLLRTIDCLWVNHPDQTLAAEYKPLQLHLASTLGLSTPKTLITNCPDDAREFIRGLDRVVYKTLGTPSLPLQTHTGSRHVFTTLLDADSLLELEAVAVTPCLFQEYVAKKAELRLTVIGREVFPVEIFSLEGEELVDWKSNLEGLGYRVYPLPTHVRAACLALIDLLGLCFGAIDMIVTPDDEYVFLELNTNAQWAWLEPETGLPMVEAMADLLMKESPPRL
jgi:glutathione synthase/RimK-type ligase-like ATP-grasp enzyme